MGVEFLAGVRFFFVLSFSEPPPKTPAILKYKGMTAQWGVNVIQGESRGVKGSQGELRGVSRSQGESKEVKGSQQVSKE